jgi:hypothetical protein
MKHYVYKIIDTQTKEFYIGSRSCKCEIKDDLYMGSYITWKPLDNSRLIKEVIRDDFDSRELAIEYEILLIKDNINNDLNRNYHIPGVGFHSVGCITVYDGNGNTFNVEKTDERYISGELKPIWYGKTHTDDTKRKMSEAKKGKPTWNKGKKVTSIETIQRIRTAALNRAPASEETRKKLSIALKGKLVGAKNPMYGMFGDKNPNYGNKWTEEQRKRQSDMFMGMVRCKTTEILQYDLDGNFIREWKTVKLACDELNLRASGISSVLTGRYKHSGGYMWKYKNDDK